jgi:hypothetical protein
VLCYFTKENSETILEQIAGIADRLLLFELQRPFHPLGIVGGCEIEDTLAKCPNLAVTKSIKMSEYFRNIFIEANKTIVQTA